MCASSLSCPQAASPGPPPDSSPLLLPLSLSGTKGKRLRCLREPFGRRRGAVDGRPASDSACWKSQVRTTGSAATKDSTNDLGSQAYRWGAGLAATKHSTTSLGPNLRWDCCNI